MSSAIPTGEPSRAQRTEAILGRYFSPEIAETLLNAEGPQPPRLVRTAVMFCDIRGFTAYSDGKPPCEVAALLANYWEHIVVIASAQGGTVNKFIGDGALILFGVPVEIPEPMAAAAHVALALRQNIEKMLKPYGLGLGIGLHYGDVIAGEIGFGERSEYTVIGGTVNLASRLESLNKELGSRILLSETAMNEVADQFQFRPLGGIPIRGLSQPVEVFELMGKLPSDGA